MILGFFFLPPKNSNDLFASLEKIKGVILNRITCQYFRSYSICADGSKGSVNNLNKSSMLTV